MSKYEKYIEKIVELNKQGISNRKIAETIYGSGTYESTVRRYLKRFRKSQVVVLEEPSKLQEMEYKELLKENGKLNKKVQRLQDTNTALRRHQREINRSSNAVDCVIEEIKSLLPNYKPAFAPPPPPDYPKQRTGIIQLSDLHFGERITYEGGAHPSDIHASAKRLTKFAEACMERFRAYQVDEVLICLTGDLMNSDRRLDELTMNSGNRAKTLLQTVDILRQFIDYVGEEYQNITVCSVVGNESRIDKDWGWVEPTASNNFDYIIHHMLESLYQSEESINFLPMKDVFECIVDINGFKLLTCHGNNRLAGNPEGEVQKLKGRYAQDGVYIDYCIFGHIHSALITDSFARSASLVGGNGYSAKGLNLSSNASQNCYIVDRVELTITGSSINLNRYDFIENPFLVREEFFEGDMHKFPKDFEPYIHIL